MSDSLDASWEATSPERLALSFAEGLALSFAEGLALSFAEVPALSLAEGPVGLRCLLHGLSFSRNSRHSRRSWATRLPLIKPDNPESNQIAQDSTGLYQIVQDSTLGFVTAAFASSYDHSATFCQKVCSHSDDASEPATSCDGRQSPLQSPSQR
jgi:hypothetical protein